MITINLQTTVQPKESLKKKSWLSSLQPLVVSRRSGKPTCAPFRLSVVCVSSETVPVLKKWQFQHWRWIRETWCTNDPHYRIQPCSLPPMLLWSEWFDSLSGPQPDFLPLRPSVTTRPVTEFYGWVDANKVPLSKVAACLFPQRHAFLKHI